MIGEAASRNDPLAHQLPGLGQHGDLGKGDPGPHAAGRGHLVQMPQEPKPCHVGGCMHSHLPHGLRSGTVQGGHDARGPLDRLRAHPLPLDPGGDDPEP